MYITYLHVSYSEGQSKSMYICYDTYIARWRKGGANQAKRAIIRNTVTRKKGRERKEKEKKNKNLKSQISNLAYSRLFTE